MKMIEVPLINKNYAKTLIILLLIPVLPLVASAGESFAYDKNIALFEKTKKAQILIDEAYGRGNNLYEAAALLNEVVIADKNYVPAYIEMSRVVLKGGHLVDYEFRGGTLEAANSLLKKAIKINPDYGATYVLLGHVYSLAGQKPAATAALNKAASLGTDNPWLHNNSAFILYSGKEYSAAKVAYEQIAAKGPGKTSQQRNSYLDALEKLMNIAYQESNDEELIKLAKSIPKAAHPNNAWAWGNAGGTLCREGFFDLGLEYNRRALSIMQYGVARSNVAFCLYGKWAELTEAGKHKEAETYFSEAYQINANIRDVAVDYSGSGARLRSLRKIFDQKINELEKLNDDKQTK
jgi:tetratricopeptide (TPR) repeat protein